MRIIAGRFKRRLLKEVQNETTRSTKDRVKETLFNMLGPLDDIQYVVDAFAGSGALGLEAISRGAKKALFYETDLAAFKVLKENIIELNLNAETTALLRNFFDGHTESNTYDLIFIDPPYHTDLLARAINFIVEKQSLARCGTLVLLSASKVPIDIPKKLKLSKSRTVGITKLTFLKWSD